MCSGMNSSLTAAKRFQLARSVLRTKGGISSPADTDSQRAVCAEAGGKRVDSELPDFIPSSNLIYRQKHSDTASDCGQKESMPVRGFWQAALADPGRPALVEAGGRTLSAQELAGASHQLVHALRARGLARGDAIAMLLPNAAPALEVPMA